MIIDRTNSFACARLFRRKYRGKYRGKHRGKYRGKYQILLRIVYVNGTTYRDFGKDKLRKSESTFVLIVDLPHVVAIEAVSPIVHVRLSSLSSSSRSDVHQASVSLSRFLPPLGPFLSFRPRSSVVGRSAAPTRSPMILPLPGGKAVLGGLAAVVHGKGEGCEIGDHVTDVTGTAGNAEQRPPIVILCRCRR